MSIASELTNLEGNIEDSYDAVNDMGGIIPAQRNMDNLDQAIRTIPQNQGTTYTAGTGIDITSDVISVDNTTVPYFSDLATVATTGDYEDLLNTPTIPAAQVNSDWNANSGVAQILNKPSLATVATSGLYSDLTGTPSLATVATSGAYDDLLNKPTIPTVNDATLTIQHNGTNVQTFTANQGTNATANVETIYADPIASSAAITPLVQTSMIADGAVTTDKLGASSVTSAKIDWSNSGGVIKTITDSFGRTGIYFGDGTLITTRKVQYVGPINTAWGSLYEGHTNDYYKFAPTGGNDFVAEPNVQVTLLNNATSGSCWLGAWENSTQIVSGGWAIPTGALCFIRASAYASNITLNLYIQAIGRWK